jgi:hypothetical protein
MRYSIEHVMRLEAELETALEVVHWAQAVLTALNAGDIKTGSLIHLKLRDVMIAYREKSAKGGDASASKRDIG